MTPMTQEEKATRLHELALLRIAVDEAIEKLPPPAQKDGLRVAAATESVINARIAELKQHPVLPE